MKASVIVDIIDDKLEEIRKQKSDYLEMLETGIDYFPQEYLIERIKECRCEIDVLKDILNEFEGRE